MENETKPGYQFAGWFVDEARTRRVNPSVKLPSNIMLYPKWNLVEYPIIYDLEEGMNSPYNPRSVTVRSGIVKLYPAVCKGKQFAGWMKDGKRITYLEDGQTGPVHLTGYFQEPSSISFETNGGSRLKSISAPIDQARLDLPVPLRLGYQFSGWYLDEALIHPLYDDYGFVEDTVLYADWSLLEYDIDYDLDGGAFEQSPCFNYTILTPTFLLPKARKSGAFFKGWQDERGNLHVMIRKGTIGSKKLKAVWREEPALRIRAGKSGSQNKTDQR